MDIHDTSSVINFLNEAAKRDPETWRIETFQMHRHSPKYGYQDATVEIWDRGAEFSPRYAVAGETKDGRTCSGNSGDDFEAVIRTVHWYQLDE